MQPALLGAGTWVVAQLQYFGAALTALPVWRVWALTTRQFVRVRRAMRALQVPRHVRAILARLANIRQTLRSLSRKLATPLQRSSVSYALQTQPRSRLARQLVLRQHQALRIIHHALRLRCRHLRHLPTRLPFR